ncbi:hypothetical protein BD309DRAFT_1021774 [Dichomitus squalens]|nr:hypothetical protein BD309DRAFT_1021774 [Dichomitus squalens]
MTMHSCYFYLVTNYSDSSTLKEGVWSLIYAPILIGLITFVSQLFFARRVFLIGPHYQVIVAIAIFFYVAEIAVSAAAIYVGVTIPSISELVKVTHYVSAAFATAVVGDLLLSYALALVLYRSRKGLKRPNTVMDLLGTYFINTGGIHLVFNILALVMSLVLPSDLIHTSINVVTTRVYAIILLTVLNSRQLMVSQGVEIIDGNFGMNIIARANRLAAQERWNVPQVPASDEPAMINIKVTTETDGDLSGKLPNDQVSGGKPFRDSI